MYVLDLVILIDPQLFGTCNKGMRAEPLTHTINSKTQMTIAFGTCNKGMRAEPLTHTINSVFLQF